MKSTIAIAALAAISVGGLAACSSSSSTSEESPAEVSTAASAEESMVGGTAACDKAAFTQAMDDQLAAEDNGEKLFSIDDFQCADGWAVVFPTVGASEENSYTITAVFEAEGQFWIPKDRMKVCGTQNMDDPTAYPDDAQVPESIYQPACNTN